MLQSDLKNSPTKPPRLDRMDRKGLVAYFQHTWDLCELLFSSIRSAGSLYERPDPLRNPLIFYFGHPAAFYINKLRMAGLLSRGVHDQYDELLAVGVDPDRPEHLHVANLWPDEATVRTYRNTIFEIVMEVIESVELPSSPVNDQHPLWALLMGLEHDRIHFETSSVLIRQLGVEKVRRPEGWHYAPTLGAPPENDWISSEGGTVRLGKSREDSLFGWDNEYGQLEVKVEPFAATRNLISNLEFLEFVEDGGYTRPDLWSDEGRDWKTRTNTTHPKFWVQADDGYLYRAMFDEMTLPLDWPAEVNAHEAWAYCRWKGENSRLLSESEFLLLTREGLPGSYDPLFAREHNLDFKYGSATPVGFMQEGTSASGFNDLYGNVWDWLMDDFYPLPGFQPHPLYLDFSEPYMDPEHSMMAGGSWATTGTGASKHYRLWFRRHFFQHAGFRLARSI
ncbi:MAG: 5-histidylcysteine sulfoxide synthase [Lewinellaceae bacterium]|nr:5-histidylcysteine sulfoxide synthase [Lewinellaceae bacterium]